MARKPLTTERILTMLAETPARIESLTANLSPTQLRTRPAPDEWSGNEVLAHLRACADVRGGCIPKILSEERPTIRAVNPRTYLESTDYVMLEFRPSFSAFSRQRNELLTLLKSLPGEAWSRAAVVKGAGKPLEYTVRHYAEWLAVHERPHVKQIARIVAAIGT
jgi:DinB family protein